MKLVNEENPNFESFKDKSNQVQRVMVIFLGVALFFFFMILLPYFSLRVDNYHFSNLERLSDIISGNFAYISAKNCGIIW